MLHLLVTRFRFFALAQSALYSLSEARFQPSKDHSEVSILTPLLLFEQLLQWQAYYYTPRLTQPREIFRKLAKA